MYIILHFTILYNSDIENEGKGCWDDCNAVQGPCEWCGKLGMCCTMKPGWTDTSNGCDGTFGGATSHECALPTPGNLFSSDVYIIHKQKYYPLRNLIFPQTNIIIVSP